MLFGCTGKSYNCDHANVDCSGGGANEADWQSPDEPSSTYPSNPAVTPREGSWFFEEPEFIEDGCQLNSDDDDSDSDEEDGTIAELSKIEGSAYLHPLTQRKDLSFPACSQALSWNVMFSRCSKNIRQIFVLFRIYTFLQPFLSETEMTATILLSYECVGDDCESIVEETENQPAVSVCWQL